jgi:hypothetical protein
MGFSQCEMLRLRNLFDEATAEAVARRAEVCNFVSDGRE